VQVLSGPSSEFTPSVVALGVFDGVHRGHQVVIRRAVERARALGIPAVVVTFEPHPLRILAPDRAPGLLQDLDQRLEVMAALGVDAVRVVSFDTARASQEARDFYDEILIGELGARAIVCGANFHFGRDRGGDPSRLREWSGDGGPAIEISDLAGSRHTWSSSLVRRLVADGDMSGARDVLGRPFSFRGEVGHGDARGGAELGWPTANVALNPLRVLPPLGVYVAATRRVGETWRPAAVSFGVRPQFYETGERLLEAHILDFSGDIYGEILDVALLEYLRPEAKFESVDALVAQIAADVEKIRDMYPAIAPQAGELLG
jgi:riboflavin kinase/FMN adenylyltransferase